jgi:diguanylate cyclase (GGDEF)-like protein
LTNPAAENILGKSQDEIIMAGFLHLVDNPDVIRNQLNADGEDDKPEQFEYRGLTLHLNASTIYTDTGTQIGTAALIRDVTEEVRLNKELEKLSTSDALTGLYNRRFLDDRLQIETHRAKRYCSELSIVLFDVDHFKKFNDEHGHTQGDRVLESLGATLIDIVRDPDLPCRYGGEEFLVILPETGLVGAQKFAERLRIFVESTEVDGLTVTISLGVASCNKGKLEDPLQFIEIADKALYQAKENGRNQVVLAPLP